MAWSGLGMALLNLTGLKFSTEDKRTSYVFSFTSVDKHQNAL